MSSGCRALLLGWLAACAFAQAPARAAPPVAEAAENAEAAVETTADAPPAAVASQTGQAAPAEGTAAAQSHNGSSVYQRFRDGLADKNCKPDSSERWMRHFSHAPDTLAREGDTLPLFAYVVDALRAASLPTEFALIPFVESGYKPAARSPGGPAGLWQMIALTARNHGVPIGAAYDGRLSPVDSTKAAVRYLKTLHGMFAGDWRLAAMAYNAGEYRILGALKRSGQTARNVDLDKLEGVPQIAAAYVRKLHALACVLDEADDRAAWRQAMSREIPMLSDIELPAGTTSLDSWAARNGIDAQALKRMNPAFAGGRVSWGKQSRRVLAPGKAAAAIGKRALWPEPVAIAGAGATATAAVESAGQRTHRVVKGDSIAKLARRYRIPVALLLSRNGLKPTSVLKPGQTLWIDRDRPPPP